MSNGLAGETHPVDHSHNEASQTMPPSSNGHLQEEHHGDAHDHAPLEIPAGAKVPSVELQIYPDAIKGWNLEVKVTDFRFAPESVNQPSDWTEGHAHLYINGTKLTRLYDRWYYLAELPVGETEITVTLNTNDHRDLWHNGKAIGDTLRVTVNP